jgi:hypothetical protein
MRVKRRPVIYDAQPSGDGFTWLVTNLITKEKKLLSDKEFKSQFEPVKEDRPPPAAPKKYEPKNYPPLEVDFDPDTGRLKVWEKP